MEKEVWKEGWGGGPWLVVVKAGAWEDEAEEVWVEGGVLGRLGEGPEPGEAW